MQWSGGVRKLEHVRISLPEGTRTHFGRQLQLARLPRQPAGLTLSWQAYVYAVLVMDYVCGSCVSGKGKKLCISAFPAGRTVRRATRDRRTTRSQQLLRNR